MGAQEAAAHCTLGRVGEAEQCHGHRYPHAMVMSMPKVNESDEKCHVFFRAVQVLRQLQVELSCWSFCGVMSFDARTQSGSEFSEGCHFGWAKGFIPALATLAWFGAKIDFELTWLNPFGMFPDAVEADFGGPRSTFSASVSIFARQNDGERAELHLWQGLCPWGTTGNGSNRAQNQLDPARPEKAAQAPSEDEK